MPEPNEQPTSQQPLNPDLMGYPTVEALVAAKRASDAEGKRLFDENQKKDLLLSQMLQNGLEGTPRQSVPDRRSARRDSKAHGRAGSMAPFPVLALVAAPVAIECPVRTQRIGDAAPLAFRHRCGGAG